MERLTYRVDEDTAIENPNNNKIGVKTCLRKLAEYEDLEEQGKLLRLRCKVGDRLYFLWECNDNQIVEMEVIEIALHKCVGNKQKNFDVIYKLAFLNREVTIHFCDDDFGKTVFFAEEEAKAVL